MHRSSLVAILALSLAGCGLDSNDPMAPQDPGVFDEPGFSIPEPQLATAPTNVWAAKAPMKVGRSALAAGVVNGLLYAVGGSNDKPLATVEAYNPGTNTWVTRTPLPGARNKPNGAGTINGVLYVPGGEDSSRTLVNSLFAYTPSTNTWAAKAPMLKPGGCGASGVIGGKLYVYSGCGRPDLSFQRYDPGANSWKALPLPKYIHSFPAAGVIDGKFYLVGGSGDVRSSTLEVYNPSSNAWVDGPALLVGRLGPTGAVINGLLYVAGGWDTDSLVKTAEVFDPGSAAWRRIAPILTPREELASGVVGGKLYAVGGYSNADITTTEVYTPGDVWVTKAAMPTAREQFAAAAAGGKFLALGGWAGGVPIALTHAYDPATNKWTGRAPMPQPRAGSNGAAVVNNIAYVSGGQGANRIYSNSLFAYNAGTNTWATKAVMPVASGCGGSGAIGGKVYVYTSCRADGSVQPGIYAYDPGTNSWSGRLSTISHGRYPAVAAINGKLYLAGGLEGSTAAGLANAFEPATGKLIELPPMNTPRYGATGVGVNGLFYVVGGRNAAHEEIGTTEVYNPAIREWLTVSGMPTARSFLGSAAISGKIYVGGGHAKIVTGDTELATMQVYAP